MTSTWRDDTPEKLAESLRREQGDDVAKMLAAYIAGAGPETVDNRNGPRRHRVGNKPLPTHAIPSPKPTGLSAEDVRERRKYAIRLGDAQQDLRKAVARYGVGSLEAKDAAATVRAAAEGERVDE